MEALSCKNLTVGYDKTIVLSGVNFSLDRGTLTVLIGANGSGKSTLLRTLSGLQSALGGEIVIDGRKLSEIGRRELSGLRAMVGTWRNGGGALTVEETVALGRNKYMSLTGRMSRSDRQAVESAMAAVGIQDFAGRYLATLSDGERQKVMIARALAQDTPVIFLDEPTAFLDVAARIDTMNLLQRLARQGKTIILSTHDIAPSVARADNLIIVDSKAKNVVFGPRDELITDGAPDLAFGNGVHFDVSILDYR